MPMLSVHGSESRYCAPTATCQVSWNGRLVVSATGLDVLSMPTSTWPNFDHCCQPTLPNRDQRSSTRDAMLAMTCCGIFVPMLTLESSNPREASSVESTGPSPENCAGALKSRSTCEVQVSPTRVDGLAS